MVLCRSLFWVGPSELGWLRGWGGVKKSSDLRITWTLVRSEEQLGQWEEDPPSKIYFNMGKFSGNYKQRYVNHQRDQ